MAPSKNAIETSSENGIAAYKAFCWLTANREIWRAKPCKRDLLLLLFASFAGKKKQQKSGARRAAGPAASAGEFASSIRRINDYRTATPSGVLQRLLHQALPPANWHITTPGHGQQKECYIAHSSGQAVFLKFDSAPLAILHQVFVGT